MFWPQKHEKFNILSDGAKSMGDNIEISSFLTLQYNATPLISLCHVLDPNHSIVKGFQCINIVYQKKIKHISRIVHFIFDLNYIKKKIAL